MESVIADLEILYPSLVSIATFYAKNQPDYV